MLHQLYELDSEGTVVSGLPDASEDTFLISNVLASVKAFIEVTVIMTTVRPCNEKKSLIVLFVVIAF